MNNREGESPSVTFFYRRPRLVGNYSVEFIFKDVSRRLRNRIDARDAMSHYESKGLFKRLYNCVEAMFRQGDVNHVTGDINFVGILLKKQRTVQTILDCGHVHASKGIKHAVIKFFWMTWPIARCRFVTAISTATKEEILKYVHCDPNKIVVIPVAISESFSKQDKTFDKSNPRILQIGTAPNKNIERLIEALKCIPCTLIIIGKRNDLYENKLKDYGMTYEYLSGLSDEEMKAQYRDADIVVLPSTYEGFGMPILEAQTVGRAVLTANISSMPEVAGGAACLVDPYDIPDMKKGFEKIISDDAYRNDLVMKGFENVRRYNPDTIAMQYFALYNLIANRN